MAENERVSVFERFTQMFPELNFWADQTKLPPVDKHDQRAIASADAKRFRIQQRNFKNMAKGGMNVKVN